MNKEYCRHYFGVQVSGKVISWNECRHEIMNEHAYEDMVGIVTRVSAMHDVTDTKAAIFVEQAGNRTVYICEGSNHNVRAETFMKYSEELQNWKMKL